MIGIPFGIASFIFHCIARRRFYNSGDKETINEFDFNRYYKKALIWVILSPLLLGLLTDFSAGVLTFLPAILLASFYAINALINYFRTKEKRKPIKMITLLIVISSALLIPFVMHWLDPFGGIGMY